MKIAFRPERRVERIEVRDLTGGSPHATWTYGDEREIADDDYTMVRDPNGEIVRRKTIDALFAVGPDFVDAKTGKNPNFTCARTGEHTADEGFFDAKTLDLIPYVDADGKRISIAEFLGDHPQYIPFHERAGVSRDILDKARALAASCGNAVAATAPPVAPVVPPVPYKPTFYDDTTPKAKG